MGFHTRNTLFNFHLEATPRIELGIKVLQTSALPLGYVAIKNWSGKRDSNSRPPPWQGDALPLSYFRLKNGASAQNRTADTRIFSPLLYQLSYRGKLATQDGLEPTISAVTGRHSNQLNYRAVCRFVSATFIIIRISIYKVNTLFLFFNDIFFLAKLAS